MENLLWTVSRSISSQDKMKESRIPQSDFLRVLKTRMSFFIKQRKSETTLQLCKRQMTKGN